MYLISAYILKCFERFWSYWKWDKGIDIYPEEETFYHTQNQQWFLKYVENEYGVKQRRVLVNKLKHILSNNLVPSSTGSGYG